MPLIPVATVIAAAVLRAVARQRADVDELSLLEELAAGDVLLLRLLGDEADVQALQVLVHVEVVGTRGTAPLVLDGRTCPARQSSRASTPEASR